jgi:hypothetical protein
MSTFKTPLENPRFNAKLDMIAEFLGHSVLGHKELCNGDVMQSAKPSICCLGSVFQELVRDNYLVKCVDSCRYRLVDSNVDRSITRLYTEYL